MDEIKKKMKELLELQTLGLDFDTLMEKQDNLMEVLKTLAKEKNTFLGRTYKIPVADGYAVYLITKINKKTVKLQWIDYCDGYSDWSLGSESANIDIVMVRATMKFEDYIDGLNTNK